jgi:hypothetical protein
MTQRERAPEPITTDERKTVELCGDEHDDTRCILRRGHLGSHESHTGHRFSSWQPRKS